MKKNLITIILIAFAGAKSFAHYLWVETQPIGHIEKEQLIKVYFGEYTHGAMEKVEGEAFAKVNQFELWVVDAKGNKTPLKTTPHNNYYLAKFTPKTNGTFTVVLNNNKIDVIDYTKYNFGIFKTHYHATTKFQVGGNTNETVVLNGAGIAVKDVSKNKNEVKLQVLFKNEPFAKNELKIFVSDLWSKTLETDENGYVSFKLPWETRYIIETTTKEEVPGKYKGEDYEFIWHCATYSIQ